MLNVKATLKQLHKKLPTLSLDELFEILDCYIEDYTVNIKDWDPKVWYSKSPDPLTTNITCATNGKVKYYDGGGSIQLTAEH